MRIEEEHMDALASLGWITIDCDDADAQAQFFRETLGWETTLGEGPNPGISDGSITIECNAVEGLAGHRRGEAVPLELMVDDLDKAAAALLAAGAAQPEFQPGGARFRVLTDRAGHPFCSIDRAVASAD